MVTLYQPDNFERERYFVVQEDLDYLAHDLNLSKEESELLGSRLQ